MSCKRQTVKFSFVALMAAAILVSLTLFFENRSLTLFPTWEYGNGGFSRCVGCGFPFAFREVVYLIDTSGDRYYWKYFILDVGLIAVAILLVMRVMIRVRVLEIE